MYCYIHPEDQQDLSNVLENGMEELENPSNEAAAGRYTDDIPFFRNEQGELRLSPLQRLWVFSGGEELLSNVSAGTGLPETAESAGASAQYHTQDGCHSGEAIFSALLAGVACIPCVSN